MWRAYRDSWALLVGVFVLMLGAGLQGSLLALRATLAGFPAGVTGIVMSAYYVGFLVGWAIVPGMIRRVGHIRVFAAFGSIASTAVLLHALVVDPASWFAIRLATGIAFCAIFIAAESWLNSKASNAIRGQLLAGYMVVLLGGIAFGQFLLNLGSPADGSLFMVASIMVSVAVVPMLLAASPAPVITGAAHLGPRRLYEISPLGTVAIVAVGVAQGALYGGVGAIYADQRGLPVPAVSLFMALLIGGGVLCQWPLGWLSDRFDRRLVITLVTFLAALASFAAALVTGTGWALFALFFLVGGLSLPMYSLVVAHANDFMSNEEMVSASGTLLLLNGVGAALGPSLGAFSLQLLGASGFPLYLALVHASIGLFALWRMTRRAAVPLAAQGPTIPLAAAAPSPVAHALAQAQAVELGQEPEPALERAAA